MFSTVPLWNRPFCTPGGGGEFISKCPFSLLLSLKIISFVRVSFWSLFLKVPAASHHQRKQCHRPDKRSTQLPWEFDLRKAQYYTQKPFICSFSPLQKKCSDKIKQTSSWNITWLRTSLPNIWHFPRHQKVYWHKVLFGLSSTEWKLFQLLWWICKIKEFSHHFFMSLSSHINSDT